MAKKMIKRQKRARPSSGNGVEKILIENFVSLQRVMTNLSVKFDDLTNKLSKLLELFEISAKTLAEKDFDEKKSFADSKKMAEKIDVLLDQNKTIARGLSLMYEKIPGEASHEAGQHSEPPQRSPVRSTSEGYQKSIPVGEESQSSPVPTQKFKPLPKR